MLEIENSTRQFIGEHRVARLATADGDGRPSVIPICYAFDGDAIYTPIDQKPKSVAARMLKRVRNIEANRHVSLLIDDYSDDWSKLVYVLITGEAQVIPSGGAEHSNAVQLLRDKYPQYLAMAIEERPMIKITPAHIRRWSMR